MPGLREADTEESTTKLLATSAVAGTAEEITGDFFQSVFNK